jgi:hypothetical protein
MRLFGFSWTVSTLWLWAPTTLYLLFLALGRAVEIATEPWRKRI